MKQANVSLMLHFVREAFELTFAGTGVTADGFLSRCTFVVDYRSPLCGDWRIVDSEAISRLMQKVRECMERKTLEIHPDAGAARLEFVHEIRQWEPKFRSRLEFPLDQDLSPSPCSRRTVCSIEGRWRCSLASGRDTSTKRERRSIPWMSRQTRESRWAIR